MSLHCLDPRRYSPRVLVLAGTIALLLFITSYLVEVRIIVVDPNYGDVTHVVRTTWRAMLGLTTIGSFLIGVYNLVTDANGTHGPSTRIEIKGTGHDIDVYPDQPDHERETTREEVQRSGANGDRNSDTHEEVESDPENEQADSTSN